VYTSKHMKKFGLLENEDEVSKESTINSLLKIFLDKMQQLPYIFLQNAYRWKIFNGTINRDNLTYWWAKMRSEYQGVIPPAARDEKDFDFGLTYGNLGNAWKLCNLNTFFT